MLTLTRLALGLIIVGIVFIGLESLWPSRRKQRKWRDGIRTDLIYWVFTPIVTKAITRAAVLLALLPAIAVLGKAHIQQAILFGHGPVAQWPVGVQVIGVIVIGDFLGYWLHRLFHRPLLWRIHAVHHSSTEVDWLSAVRLHPLNDVVARVVQALPILLLGFPATLTAAYIPFISFYALLLHANVSWSFGSLRYVIASPRFHRWHHTSEQQGLDKNFAGLLPLWDLLFGTYYMPLDKQPEQFGVLHDPVPPGIIGQLLYPFKRQWH